MGSDPAIASVSIGTKAIRKLRVRILPVVFLLFVVALLDRINVGFAALTMNKELAITSQQFGLVFRIFLSATFSLRFRATCCSIRSACDGGLRAS
jgi:hypothetical protein